VSLDESVRESFESVVLPHLDAAYTVARYLVRDEQDAQDVVQEAFLRAVRHYDGYRGDNARAWLLTIVRNCCATWKGRRRAHREHLEFDERSHSEGQEDATPEIFLLRSSAAESVRRAVDLLPAEAREALVLRDVEDLSYREIGVVLGIPIGTVMSLLSRARKRLQAILAKEVRDAG
jgi:RNA polymerase sigma-70 factor (ECF subfamily)